VIVDIDMEKLLYSFGKELHFEELVFDGIEVIYEAGLHGSNVDYLLEKLKTDQATQANIEEVAPRVVLHTVSAHNIGAKIAAKFMHGHGIRIEVGSLQYEDFETEATPCRGIRDAIRTLVSTLLKTVAANVVGRDGTKAMKEAAHGVTDKIKKVGAGLKEGCCTSMSNLKSKSSSM